MSLVAAIDPSTACTGWAVLRSDGSRVASGAIRKPTIRDIEDFAARWGPVVDHVALEDQYIKFARTALVLAECRGMWRYAMGVYGPKTCLVTPSAWRQVVLPELPPKAKREVCKAAAVAWAVREFGLDLGEDESESLAIGRWLCTKLRGIGR